MQTPWLLHLPVWSCLHSHGQQRGQVKPFQQKAGAQCLVSKSGNDIPCALFRRPFLHVHGPLEILMTIDSGFFLRSMTMTHKEVRHWRDGSDKNTRNLGTGPPCPVGSSMNTFIVLALWNVARKRGILLTAYASVWTAVGSFGVFACGAVFH